MFKWIGIMALGGALALGVAHLGGMAKITGEVQVTAEGRDTYNKGIKKAQEGLGYLKIDKPVPKAKKDKK